MRTRAGDDDWRGGGGLTAALAMLPVQPVAKGLAGLEGRHGAGRDGDGFAAAGIAALARRTVAGGELAEARDVDRLAVFECVGDGRDDGVDRGGGVAPGQRRAGDDAWVRVEGGPGRKWTGSGRARFPGTGAAWLDSVRVRSGPPRGPVAAT